MRNQEQNEHPVLGRYPLYFKLTFAVFAAITLIWAAMARLTPLGIAHCIWCGSTSRYFPVTLLDYVGQYALGINQSLADSSYLAPHQ